MTFEDIFNATLNRDHTISIHINKSYTSSFTKHFYLYCDDVRLCELAIVEKRESGHHFHYEVNNVPALTIGSEYKVYDDRYMYCYLNMNVLLKSDRICSLYRSGETMGAHYHKFFTTFRLFSPLAKSAYVVCKKDGIESMVALEKNTDTGIFSGRVQGDLSRATYYFLVRINGKLISANDPYCYGLTGQSSRGVIVDPEEVRVDMKEKYLGRFPGITDAVIYELSVRDMTSMKNTSIRHKGKFLGLTETSCKSINANPIGLDYIKSLGVTHVQVMPMFDFCTVCDENPKESYNWGYDPLYFNVPEGSYATNPQDPYARIIEAKKMIAAFHKAGIRVVMDVVYNHVFNLESSPFEKLCPSYYFRFREDGTPSNGSFCGNEFNSLRPMARKFLLDSCLHWVKEYSIDGFRFDLMGLIDIDTINEIQKLCREVKPDFIIYGEGWEMPTVMQGNLSAKMANAHLMPDVGFFNDRFRDVVKGKSGDMELAVKGYLLGDTNYIDGFKHCFLGSCLPLAFPPLFQQPLQSVNYVECHDNATLYDKLKISNSYEPEETILERINLINAVTVLACGVPFIHAGQEFGATKHGYHNSFDAGDDINHFNYNLMDERYDMVRFFREVLAFRKEHPLFRLSDRETIAKTVEFQNLEFGALRITYQEEGIPKKMHIIVNPCNAGFSYSFGAEAVTLFDKKGTVRDATPSSSFEIPPVSLTVFREI